MSSLDSLLAFTRFLHLAHKVERVARTPGETRRATLVEHSFQLALTAWYIADREHLPLDRQRMLMYALAHDLLETYAGDTYLYDDEAIKTKHAREADAIEQMQRELPDFAELHEHIAAYEKREDNESRFVYALDKLLDPLNIYLDNGTLWHEMRVTLPMLLDKKTDKVALDATVQAYFDELVTHLRTHETELFHSAAS